MYALTQMHLQVDTNCPGGLPADDAADMGREIGLQAGAVGDVG